MKELFHPPIFKYKRIQMHIDFSSERVVMRWRRFKSQRMRLDPHGQWLFIIQQGKNWEIRFEYKYVQRDKPFGHPKIPQEKKDDALSRGR